MYDELRVRMFVVTIVRSIAAISYALITASPSILVDKAQRQDRKTKLAQSIAKLVSAIERKNQVERSAESLARHHRRDMIKSVDGNYSY